MTVSVAVTEPTHAAEVRRAAVSAAHAQGFDVTDSGRVAIVASEAASNVLKHGGGGQVLIGSFDDPCGSGVEIMALDQGRGILNIAAALTDGFSTAGSAGNGLGAIRRMADVFDIASWPENGTALLARVAPRGRKLQPGHPPFAGLSVAKLGQETCGDAWAAASAGGRVRWLVVDGLGHGPEAARAAAEAVRVFRLEDQAPAESIKALHGALKPTRGAAAAVGVLEGRTLHYAGIGNIAGAIVSGDGRQMRKLVSMSGTAGLTAARIQEFAYDAPPDAIAVVHSDGLSGSWSLASYPGLSGAHPALVCGVLLRDFARGRDDAAIFVGTLRYAAPDPG